MDRVGRLRNVEEGQGRCRMVKDHAREVRDISVSYLWVWDSYGSNMKYLASFFYFFFLSFLLQPPPSPPNFIN